LTQTFMVHCSAMICQSVTLSGDAEWPKVADAVIEAPKRTRKLTTCCSLTLSRNFLPDRQSGIDFYHKFCDTFCWAEGSCCAVSINRAYMSPLRREVERLLEAGSRCGVPKTAGTCRDILKRREALWTFVQGEGVEPTNNTAERSIRPGVLWHKGSFGTPSAEGSRFVESMMTVVSTLKQQQRNVLEYLTEACEAALRGDAAPSLLPTNAQKSQTAA
jgi:hypothetical protein